MKLNKYGIKETIISLRKKPTLIKSLLHGKLLLIYIDMRMLIKKIIPHQIFKRLKNLGVFIYPDYRKSYSQSGEDMILNNIFLFKNRGFYIDVGANHPTKASNTYFFYKKGWSGINIDALPESINMFKKKRKKDINIEVGVSDSLGILNFHIFKESSYNTFDEDVVSKIEKISPVTKVKKVPVKPLTMILDELNIFCIDFMSVDVEGFDLNVLISNNWEKYRPKVVIVEDFYRGMDVLNSPTYKFMCTVGYIYFCQTNTNVFYIEQCFFNERYNHK